MDEELYRLVKENNIMLREIIAYLNQQTLNADKENVNDFIRNVFANMISSNFELNKFR